MLKFAALVWALLIGFAQYGQAQSNSGIVQGSVLDPSGQPLPARSLRFRIPSRITRATALTDSQGNFEFEIFPTITTTSALSAAGFQAREQDMNVRSPVPLELKISLKLGKKTSVTVRPARDLVETDPTPHRRGSRLCSTSFLSKARLPHSVPWSHWLLRESAPIRTAYFTDSGDHASNSFSVDGQPITDQQSKVFSNQLPVDAVQSMEVIEGAPPAEYGGKTSVVIVVTTRSGLGVTEPHGEVTASYGSFGTSNGGFDLAYGGKTWGNFISRQRPEHRPVSGWAGIHQSSTIMATNRTCSTAWTSSLPRRIAST